MRQLCAGCSKCHHLTAGQAGRAHPQSCPCTPCTRKHIMVLNHRGNRRTPRPGVHVSSTARPMSGMPANMRVAAPPPHDSMKCSVGFRTRNGGNRTAGQHAHAPHLRNPLGVYAFVAPMSAMMARACTAAARGMIVRRNQMTLYHLSSHPLQQGIREARLRRFERDEASQLPALVPPAPPMLCPISDPQFCTLTPVMRLQHMSRRPAQSTIASGQTNQSFLLCERATWC